MDEKNKCVRIRVRDTLQENITAVFTKLKIVTRHHPLYEIRHMTTTLTDDNFASHGRVSECQYVVRLKAAPAALVVPNCTEDPDCSCDDCSLARDTNDKNVCVCACVLLRHVVRSLKTLRRHYRHIRLPLNLSWSHHHIRLPLRHLTSLPSVYCLKAKARYIHPP